MSDYDKKLIRSRLTETFERALYWYEVAEDHFSREERRAICHGILEAIEATELFDGYEYMRFYEAFNETERYYRGEVKPYKYTMLV